MNILIIGSGAREHALGWKLSQSKKVKRLYFAPGNGGTSNIGQNLNINATEIVQLCETAKKLKIDLSIVGPELPLANGIVDHFKNQGLMIFGPTQSATRIESSKAFAKELMQKYNIPCAKSTTVTTIYEAEKQINKYSFPVVLKADGLAAGKGVIIVNSKSEALKALEDFFIKRIFSEAGEKVIIEEYLNGKEVSLLAFTDGNYAIPMVPACDYKRAFDNDKGPNTGGMGSYSPPKFFTYEHINITMSTIINPVISAMKQENCPYSGVLYAGLMLTDHGPKVLEFNARFGDPETQVILPRLKTDLIDIMLSVCEGQLAQINIEWCESACLGVVLASKGYPEKYETGFPISGLNQVDNDILIFHAGTKIESNKNNLITSGGRVLTIVAKGSNIIEAREKVYSNINKVHFNGCFFRNDIGAREIL